jgi:pyruvate carboxylase
LPRGDEDLEKAGIHIGGLGDAGEMLDEQAKVAYRRRLSPPFTDIPGHIHDHDSVPPLPQQTSRK